MMGGWLLVAYGIGHLCLLVLLVNWVHGVGFRARWWTEAATIVGAGAIGVATVLVGLALARADWRAWPWMLQAYGLVCVAVALIGLPWATVVRALRRLPPGVSGDSRRIDLAASEGAERLIGPGRRNVWLRLPGNESFRLEQSDWTIACPGLPPGLDGLTILHISDLHFARTFDRRFFDAVAEAAAGWDADLSLFTGDLIDDEAVIDWIGPVMSRFCGRLGSYAIMGNHDYHFDTNRLGSELDGAGFVVIDGCWTRLEVGGSSLAIGGTSEPWGPALDPRLRPAADAALLLSHTPDLLPRVASWGIDWMFSGHNHGGQVRFPVLGPVLMPSRYGRRYDHGFFRAGRTLLHVSRGVAAKHPIRYACPPEITRLTLRAAIAPAAALVELSERAVTVSRR